MIRVELKLIFEANYDKVAAPMFCVRLLEY